MLIQQCLTFETRIKYVSCYLIRGIKLINEMTCYFTINFGQCMCLGNSNSRSEFVWLKNVTTNVKQHILYIHLISSIKNKKRIFNNRNGEYMIQSELY